MSPLRVLVVDDEPITAEAHAAYLARLEGFEVAGIAENGAQAVRLLQASAAASGAGRIDLVLLDMNLPDVHGIELCRHLRSVGVDVDVIAVTAVRDIAVVRAAVSLGIVQYLIKPFAFPVFAEKLNGYRAFRSGLGEVEGVTTQDDVDQSFASLRTESTPVLDKGLAPDTRASIIAALRATDSALSASEVASELRISRVTARRYLENLAASGTVERAPRYGQPGRPEFEYRWRR
ncbi:response regulator [Herbiconiux ginsengi]|uniref:Transcriptional regulatory protein n=1 Tax=Herbiconiux ginsengi TaxID=381665 RepID=A0A1H3RJH0_9MICO|nr:response regulator [Herbiconiux ginsengi]SDZ25837.1 Response regulator of citrate/malate metabolism [Herbiconiux ginsengi]